MTTNISNIEFTAAKLAVLKSIAIECNEPAPESRVSNERAVIVTCECTTAFSPDELVVINLIARECETRKSGALKVYDCVEALGKAFTGETFDEALVALIDRVVDSVVPKPEGYIAPKRMLASQLRAYSLGGFPFSDN